MRWRKALQNSLNNSRLAEERADEGFTAEEHLHTLRSLLLSDEHQDVTGLTHRIEALERSSGGPVHVAKPAPAIVDDEQMVAALQPHFWRLMRGGIGHALNRLGRRTNRTVDALLSWRLAKLRLKAIITGQSLGELVSSELLQTEIRRIYLVVRDTGTLLYHWSNEDFVEQPSSETTDEILTTIHVLTEFAPERQDMPLRRMVLSESQVVIQASARHVVAIEIAPGTMTDSRREIISFACRTMFEAAETHRASDEESFERETMTAFATSLVSRQQEKKNRRANPAYVLGLLLLLGGVSWYSWRTWHHMQITQSAASIEQAIRRNFRTGDVVVDVVPDRAARRITVIGMGFGPGNAKQIERRAQNLAKPYNLDFNLVVRDLDAARLERVALSATLSDAQLALAEARAQMHQMAATGGTPTIGMADPVDALRDWTRDNAIFFGDGTTLRDPAFAARQIDRLATLMAAAPDSRLRVEGFTNGDNRHPSNSQMARARAITVIDALLLRGITADRLIGLGGKRSDTSISDITGPTSPNNRVEFSLAFTGE